ncbi:24050_t:CDS:2, partial [Entrophospora sp. SA101]
LIKNHSQEAGKLEKAYNYYSSEENNDDHEGQNENGVEHELSDFSSKQSDQIINADEIEGDEENEDNENVGNEYLDDLDNGDGNIKKSLLRLTDSNQTEINVAYKSMKKENIWKLSNGKYLEEEFRKELEEISAIPCPAVTTLSNDTMNYLSKFIDKKSIKEFCGVLNEFDERFGASYDREKHHDIDYIRMALYSFPTPPSTPLQSEYDFTDSEEDPKSELDSDYQPPNP